MQTWPSSARGRMAAPRWRTFTLQAAWSRPWAACRRTPLEPLAASEDAARLRATGQEGDIAWCARESVLEVIPEVWSSEDGASVVGPAGASHRGESIKVAEEFA